MASSPSASLRLELMATGDQSGTWGDTTNTNLGTLLEQAITGYLSVAQGDVADLTLTTTNYATDQARNAVVEITGALTATRNVVVQTAEKLYTIKNSTTGGFSIVAKTSAGTGISIPPGASIDCYSDGTNVVSAANYWNGSIGGMIYLDAGAAVGPNFDLFRDSTSPAISDILGRVTFNGRDSAGNKQEYASIETVIVSPTSTTEAGAVDIYAVKAGTRTKMASLTAAATAFTAAAAYSFDNPLSISSTANGTVLTLTSTEAGAGLGPAIDLYRDSASPANADGLGSIIFNGRDSGGNKQTYAQITAVIADVTSASEDSYLQLSIVAAGGAQNQLYLGLNAAGSGTADAIGLPRGQLSFPATQNPSSDVNTLDDYEEGSTTPTPTSGTGSFTSVSSTVLYNKVGRQVLIVGEILVTTNGTAATNIQVALPFTNANLATNYPLGRYYNRTTAATGGKVTMSPNSTTAILSTDANAYPTLSDGQTLNFTISYLAAN